jgi:hypothetical protein
MFPCPKKNDNVPYKLEGHNVPYKLTQIYIAWQEPPPPPPFKGGEDSWDNGRSLAGARG